MKTTKFVLFIVLMSLGTMVFSQPKTNSHLIRISLEDAIQNQKLVKAMCEQLDLVEILKGGEQPIYTAQVKLYRKVYEIYGDRAGWVDFFLGVTPDPNIVPPPER